MSVVTNSSSSSPTQAVSGVQFIRSQKKNAQLVYKGFIYNKKLTQANGHTTWRCSDVSKNKCRAVVLTKRSRLVVAKRQHIHEDHWDRIGVRTLYDVEDELDSTEFVELDVKDPFYNTIEWRSIKQVPYNE